MTKACVKKLIGRRAWTGKDGLCAHKTTRTLRDCGEMSENREMKELDASSLEGAALPGKEFLLTSLQFVLMQTGGAR